MKNKLKKIILGNFLIDEGSFTKWKYIVFLFSMCLIMIFSSHALESKIKINNRARSAKLRSAVRI